MRKKVHSRLTVPTKWPKVQVTMISNRLENYAVAIGHVVKLSPSIGSSFSYKYSSDNNGNPVPAVVEKPKNKSPTTFLNSKHQCVADDVESDNHDKNDRKNSGGTLRQNETKRRQTES